MPSLRRVTALAWLPVTVLALVWGCAEGAATDLMPEIDPALPDVDAGWHPSPQGPGSKVPGTDPDAAPASSSGKPKPVADGGADSGSAKPNPPGPVGKAAQGDFLITEVLYDSSGSEPSTEWIEIHNTTSQALSLSGLTIVDGGERKHVIGAGVTVAAGAYVVLARLKSAAIAAKVPAAAIVYEYGAGDSDGTGVQLANGASGAVWLRDGTTTLAQASYGGWYGSATGRSIQLETLTYAASGQSSSWCLSQTAWATGADKGTPGAASDCP